MSRWEFMRQLEELLADISPSEREEALQYYNDYFNDAGRENEAEVIEALGSPKQVAQTVKEGLGFETKTIEQKERESDESTPDSNEAKNQRSDWNGTNDQDRTWSNSEQGTEKSWLEQKKQQAKELPTWAIVLIICAVVICAPVLFGILGSLLGTVFGILASIVGIAIGIAAAAVALLIAAIALVITGIATCVTYPFLGMALTGAGLICGAVGILFLILTVLLFGKGIPALCEGIKYLWRKYVKKEKEVLA